MNKYLNKHLKVKSKNLKYDFLPSMLEVIEKPENPLSNIIIILILLLIISSVVWAAFGRVDIVITAQGSIMPEGNLIGVVNAYAGEISELNVEDGAYVACGDVITAMDTKEEEAQLEELKYHLKLLKCQQDVYRKIQEYNLREEKTEDENFGIKVWEYGSCRATAETIITEQKLFLLRCKEYDLPREGENKTLLRQQKENYIAERDLTIRQNIDSLEVKINETVNDMEELQRVIENKRIVSPASGIVSNLAVNTTGQILPSGQTVCYIIPEEAEAQFVAYVKSSDIESVSVGDKVSIKITALRDTEYEILTGKVSRIGDLALSAEGLGNVYKVEISLEEVPEELLRIGTDGTCDIIAGERSVLAYFLEPFIEGLQDSLHEK